MQLRPAIDNRHALDTPAALRSVVGLAFDRLPDQTGGTGDILSQQDRVECVGQPVGRSDFADLTDLLQHLGVVERIEWILVLEFRDHQFQEVVDIQVVHGVGRVALVATAKRDTANGRDLGHGLVLLNHDVQLSVTGGPAPANDFWLGLIDRRSGGLRFAVRPLGGDRFANRWRGCRNRSVVAASNQLQTVRS